MDEEQGVESKEINTQLDLQVDAYIPERYIKNHNQRIDVYKQIASLETDEDESEIIDELCDRYGAPPRAVRTLIEVAKLKSAARSLGITMLSEKGDKLTVIFADDMLDSNVVIGLMKKMPERIKIVSGTQPKIIFRLNSGDGIISNIKFLLQSIFELKNEQK